MSADAADHVSVTKTDVVFPKACGGLLNAAEKRGLVAKDAPAVHFYISDAGQYRTVEVVNFADGSKGAKFKHVLRKDVTEVCKEGFEVSLIPEEPLTGIEPDHDYAKVNNQFSYATNIPSNFTVIRFNGVVYGNIFTVANSPSDKSTQFSSFDLQTYGYGASTEHLVYMLRANGAVIQQQQLDGNGIIIGVNSGDIGRGCGNYASPSPYNIFPAFNAQYEAWWPSGNKVYPQGCGSAALVDGIKNHFDIHANKFQDVWFQRYNYNSGQWTVMPAVNSSGARPAAYPWNPSLGGTIIGSTNDFGGTSNFSMYFTNVVVGWF